jgi:hypothetical protein
MLAPESETVQKLGSRRWNAFRRREPTEPRRKGASDSGWLREGSEDENRMPEIGDEEGRAPLGSTAGGRVMLDWS